MARAQASGSRSREADVRILNYVNAKGDDKYGIFYDVVDELRNEVYFLTERVANGELEKRGWDDARIKSSVYDTSVAIRKFKKFFDGRQEFSRFTQEVSRAEALLNDADFGAKSYKAEMERGFNDGDTAYAGMESQIKKIESSQIASRSKGGQAKTTQSPDAQDSQKKRKLDYNRIHNDIETTYNAARNNIAQDNLDARLETYQRQLGDYMSTNPDSLSSGGKAQRNVDIAETQRTIRELRRQIEQRNEQEFTSTFSNLRTQLDQIVPSDRVFRRKNKTERARALDDAKTQLARLEDDFSDRLTDDQRIRIDRYRSRLTERHANATRSIWRRSLFPYGESQDF